MRPLRFFDSNCVVGESRNRSYGVSYNLENLLYKMDLYGIDKAMVYHFAAKEYEAKYGNDALMEEIKDTPNLYPVWVVMHHHTDEFHEPLELIELLRQKNIKAVKIYPDTAQFSVEKWNCGALFSALEANKTLLLMDADQLAVSELHRMLSDYPALNVVLTAVGYRMDRNLQALMKIFSRLFVETYGYKVNDGIEVICEKFGAHRLVFGSGMPVFSGGSAVSMIRYARISDDEKRMIAYENLKNLLGGA